MPYEIYLNEDEKEFKLPLVQFCDSLMFWKMVSEIKFLFYRKKVKNKGKVVIKNLRIEWSASKFKIQVYLIIDCNCMFST